MRVLFVVKEYLPKATATGLCVMNVQKALLERNVKSDVLMVGETEGKYCEGEYGDVYCIQSDISFEKKKQGIVHSLKVRVPMLFSWPVPSKKRVKDYVRVINQLNAERHYDAIIGTMFPPDVCVACSEFEHFFYYELDSIVNNPMYKEGLKKYLRGRLVRLEKKLFDRAEMIIHLNHNSKFYSKKEYDKYIGKSVYTDIPEITPVSKTVGNETGDSAKENDQVLLVYSGHLSKEFRSPTRLIELVKYLSKSINVKCLFFSRGECEDELRKAEADTSGTIKRMGFVSPEELARYTEQADFLLDIGNCLTGEDYSLPSKVICYIATGKPIIHLNGTNDIAVQYLDKYGLALNVDRDLSIEKAGEQILQFIENNRNKRVDFNEIVEKFPQNTPGYTADIIIKKIESRSNS